MPLDAKAVEQKAHELAKAAAGGASPALLALLDELRRGVAATESLLRTTKIGVAVNKLKQHRDPAVARASADLVSKWRADVSRIRGGAGQGGSGASTPKPNGVVSPKGAKGAVEKVKLAVPKEKRNHQLDNVQWRVTKNEVRDNCIRLTYDGLAYMSEERECFVSCSSPALTPEPAPNVVLAVAVAVEAATFAAWPPETSKKYREKIRSLYQNLKAKTSGPLRERVVSGVIAPDVFVHMTHAELRSAERRREDEMIMKENMDKAMVAKAEKSVSQHLQCGKCGQRKVSYTQAQTRSADEPMTTFCECLHCGNKWKFS
jgi:transcription elongation factor S-II